MTPYTGGGGETWGTEKARLNDEIAELQAQLRTAREALEYYAVESSWDSPQRDRGAIARQALTHLEGEG